MGQRELILMLLASVITGLAVFAGIQIFNNQEIKFEEEAYEQKMLELGEKLQSYYIKPKQLGGGGRSYQGINFNKIPCPLVTLGSSTKTCQDADGKHKLVITSIENHHAKVISLIRLRQRVYVGNLEVKADTALILGEWVSH